MSDEPASIILTRTSMLTGLGMSVTAGLLAESDQVLTAAGNMSPVTSRRIPGLSTTHLITLLVGKVSVTLRPDVVVPNRVRGELHTQDGLDWVNVNAIRVGDLVGLGLAEGETPFSTRMCSLVQGEDFSYEEAHRMVWMRVNQAIPITYREPLVEVLLPSLIVNGISVHA